MSAGSAFCSLQLFGFIHGSHRLTVGFIFVEMIIFNSHDFVVICLQTHGATLDNLIVGFLFTFQPIRSICYDMLTYYVPVSMYLR